MSNKITMVDYIRMPVFQENWLTLVGLILPILILRFTLFKKTKISVVYLNVIFLLSCLVALPLQSFITLKTWNVSEDIVLMVMFPGTAAVVATVFSLILMTIKKGHKKKSKR